MVWGLGCKLGREGKGGERREDVRGDGVRVEAVRMLS